MCRQLQPSTDYTQSPDSAVQNCNQDEDFITSSVSSGTVFRNNLLQWFVCHVVSVSSIKFRNKINKFW